MKKKIYVEEVLDLKKRLRKINEIAIEEAIFIDKNDKIIEPKKDEIEFWKMTGLNISDFVEMQLSLSPQHNLAVKKLKEATEKCISLICRNSAGVLWESLWKHENGKFMQKTSTSGLFNDWRIIESEDEALDEMITTLERIERIERED